MTVHTMLSGGCFRRRTALVAALAAVLALEAAPALAAPTMRQTMPFNAPPGTLISIGVDVFANAGTNPRFTSAVFSTTEYYNALGLPETLNDRRLFVEAKTEAELNALESPPDSPFTVTAEVSMTNDEGETATGTVTFKTTYTKDAAPELPQQSIGTSEDELTVAPGATIRVKAADVFNNAGTEAVFTGAVFSTTAYYNASRIERGHLLIQVKTDAELNALPLPPESPFTVTVEVTMRNSEGVEATATLHFATRYVMEAPKEEDPEGPADAAAD